MLLLILLSHVMCLGFVGKFSDEVNGGFLYLCTRDSNVFGRYTDSDDNTMGLIRASLETPSTASGVWISAYESVGISNYNIREDESGIDETWSFNDEIEKYILFENSLDLISSDEPSNSECMMPDENIDNTNMNGLYGTDDFITTNTVYSDILGKVGDKTLRGKYSSLLSGYFGSGTTIDASGNIGGFIFTQMSEDSYVYTFFSDTVDTFESEKTLTITERREVKRSEVTPNYDSGDSNTMIWDGTYSDGEYTTLLINVNGKIHGFYTGKDMQGFFKCDLSEDGLTAEGYWYEADVMEYSHGRMKLTLDDTKDGYTGKWGILEEEPTNDWSSTETGDKRISIFVTHSDCYVFDDRRDLACNQYYDYNGDRSVVSPFTFCLTGEDDLTVSYYDDECTGTGKYFEDYRVAIFEWVCGEETGASIYIPTYSGKMKGFYVDFEVEETFKDDGPYLIMEEDIECGNAFTIGFGLFAFILVLFFQM